MGSPVDFWPPGSRAPGDGPPWDALMRQGIVPSGVAPGTPIADDASLQQWFAAQGAGAGPDPGYPHWQAVRDLDDFTHYIAYKSPNGTKTDRVKLATLNNGSAFTISWRAICIGAAPPAGLRIGFSLTTADGEQWDTLNFNCNTGTYLLTGAWKDFTASFNDSGPAAPLGFTRLAIVGQFPAGFGGYHGITRVRVTRTP